MAISPEEIRVLEAYFDMLKEAADELMDADMRLKAIERGVRSILNLHDDDEVLPYMERLDDIIKPEGFTDAVRKVLKASGKAMTPSEVKEKLPLTGFDLAGYNNPLASIHTILKRLAKTDFVVTSISGDGKTAYKWAALTGLGQAILEGSAAEQKAHRIAKAREEMQNKLPPFLRKKH